MKPTECILEIFVAFSRLNSLLYIRFRGPSNIVVEVTKSGLIDHQAIFTNYHLEECDFDCNI